MDNDNTVEYIAPMEDEIELADESEEADEVEAEEDTDVETPEVFTFAGRQFSSMEEAERAYKEMQADSTKSKQQLAKVEKQIKNEMLKAELQGLDPEERIARLTDFMLGQEELEEEVEVAEESAPEADDTAEVEAFAKGHPILRQFPELQEQFVILASNQYKGYTLDSIFDSKFKPLIDRLAGKKVTVKTKVSGGKASGTGLSDEVIQKMKPAEYEKRREEILKFYSQQ
jgi:hypothetical protein